MAYTTWLGTTSDATLNSNWSNGVPDNRITSGGVDVYIGSTVTTSLTGFGSERSFQNLTTTGNFSNNETVVIGAKTYTFVDPAAPSSDGEVDVGSNAEESIDNLVAAITLGAGSGTAYAAATTAHPTCTGTKATAAIFRTIALNAGTGGDAISVSETCANASWGAGTLQSGSANGATVNNVWLDRFQGDINSSGSAAQIAFNKFYHNGSGTVYIDAQSGNRFIVDSPNYALAAHLIMTSDVANSIEVVQGRLTLNWNGLTGGAGIVWVSDSRGLSENLSVTGTGTIPLVIVNPGIVTTNGPTITAFETGAGFVTHSSGAVTTLRVHGGRFQLDATQTITTAYIMAGTVDTTQTLPGKTIGTAWVSPSAELVYRTDNDDITPIRYIGDMGEF